MRNKWDKRFLRLAREIASWSKDPSTKVGAVIVRSDKTIVSLGYNGFPRGVPDTPEKLQHRDTKLAHTVHAELNAILNAREPLRGTTLYTWPIEPCSHCKAAIIQAGITNIVTMWPSEVHQQRWGQSFHDARAMGADIVNTTWFNPEHLDADE